MSALPAIAPARRGQRLPVLILLAILALLISAAVPAPAPAATHHRAASHHVKKTKKKHKHVAKKNANRPATKPRVQGAGTEASTKTSPKASSPSATVQRFGINAGGALSLPEPQLSTILRQFQAGGLTYVRADLSWSGVQQQPDGAYDWSRTDAFASALASSGLRWYPVVAYSTTWSGVTKGDLFSRPADPADYAAFVAAAAQRYGPNGSFWAAHPELPKLPMTHYELWNEENARMFWREQDTAPEAYADLYATARDALHAVDPDAKAIVGGLVEWGATDFVRRFYAHRNDLRGHVDGIGYHLYNVSAADQLASMATMRQALDQVDPGVPLEITEQGLSSVWMPEGKRAAQFAAVVKGVRTQPKLGVASLFPFSAITEQQDPENWQHWLGLWNPDGTAKPSALAYMAAVRAAT